LSKLYFFERNRRHNIDHEKPKHVKFDNQLYTLPLMAKEETTIKLKTSDTLIPLTESQKGGTSQSSHSSLRSDDDNEDKEVSSQDDDFDN